ncbi:hypothetical protein GTS_08150 [Gandjariella thermophila]|uniref:DUF1707 domain-containing protein n=1 Tax=Gandjariella thermophila TaxID=1931992 RepID=A0A4D4J253_9PSEU|nr:hypothetical protein GTS_08150 [Gandjariella thermophila]
MRASDADRERVAQVLHQAMSEGRLSLAELEQRLDVVYAAKTYADLEPVTRDLPTASPIAAGPDLAPATAGSPARVSRIGGTPGSSTAIAVMSGVERRGDWVVPAHLSVVAIMGGADLDLRAARFAERECTINVIAIMGGARITVPDDLTVRVEGVGVMGGFDRRGEGGGDPSGPVLRVTGLALMGGVEVRRKPRDGRKALEG